MNDGITPLSPEQVAKQEKQAGEAGFIHRNLIALDMLGNTLTGGHDDETISSRSARDAEQGRIAGIIMSKFLDVFQRNHGAKAIAGDLERANTVKAIEESDPVIEK
jgi:hypothetical protein